jgi:methyltransferase
MQTQFVFIVIVLAVVLQRLWELRISKANETYLLRHGGQMRGANNLKLVKIIQLSWFAAMILEVWYLDRPFIPGLASLALLLLLLGQLLRYLSMKALGHRWTLPLITLPGVAAVNSGVYRFLRHPNWLGVILEIAALPLIHSAYITAVVFSAINAVLMVSRVQQEETALTADSDYEKLMGNRPRFIWLPRLSANASTSR